MKKRIHIGKVGAKRATFPISWDFGPTAKPRYQKLDDPRATSINHQFKAGLITAEQAYTQLLKLREDIYAEIAPPQIEINPHNTALFHKFFESEIAPRHILSKRTVKFELRRIANVLGSHSLSTISNQTLQQTYDAFPSNVQRRLVMRTRSLLRFIGRNDIRLHRKPLVEKTLKHLSFSEFEQVIAETTCPIKKSLYILGFTTGCRVSEIFGLRKSDLRQRARSGISIYVERQKVEAAIAMEAERVRLPKNKRKRFVVPIKQKQLFIPAFTLWTSLTEDERESVRYTASPQLKQLCKTLFNEPRCFGGMHMLRASHAIYLLGKGASISIVAKQLGDSVLVTERYYSGYSLLDEQLDIVQAISA